ncbi:MAG: transcriptional repressor LexA [Clostridiales bacterium]|nr:transcriptional repressor LexA [Clostridiales bacterium]
MKPLTAMQQAVLDCIKHSISEYGFPPSVREICDYVGLKSPSTVHSHLNSLERMGYLHRSSGKTRAITLTPLATQPEGIPILGTVAAGQPILAVEDAIGYLDYYTGNSGNYFALRIRGSSMINAGILDGDMVVVRKQATAEHGDIVIALIDDEATCKRLSKNNGQIWLLAENDDYDDIDGSQAQILGKVTTIIRQYN